MHLNNPEHARRTPKKTTRGLALANVLEHNKRHLLTERQKVLYVRVGQSDKELLERIAKDRRSTLSDLARLFLMEGAARLGYLSEHEKKSLGLLVQELSEEGHGDAK